MKTAGSGCGNTTSPLLPANRHLLHHAVQNLRQSSRSVVGSLHREMTLEPCPSAIVESGILEHIHGDQLQDTSRRFEARKKRIPSTGKGRPETGKLSQRNAAGLRASYRDHGTMTEPTSQPQSHVQDGDSQIEKRLAVEGQPGTAPTAPDPKPHGDRNDDEFVIDRQLENREEQPRAGGRYVDEACMGEFEAPGSHASRLPMKSLNARSFRESYMSQTQSPSVTNRTWAAPQASRTQPQHELPDESGYLTFGPEDLLYHEHSFEAHPIRSQSVHDTTTHALDPSVQFPEVAQEGTLWNYIKRLEAEALADVGEAFGLGRRAEKLQNDEGMWLFKPEAIQQPFQHGCRGSFLTPPPCLADPEVTSELQSTWWSLNNV